MKRNIERFQSEDAMSIDTFGALCSTATYRLRVFTRSYSQLSSSSESVSVHAYIALAIGTGPEAKSLATNRSLRTTQSLAISDERLRNRRLYVCASAACLILCLLLIPSSIFHDGTIGAELSILRATKA